MKENSVAPPIEQTQTKKRSIHVLFRFVDATPVMPPKTQKKQVTQHQKLIRETAAAGAPSSIDGRHAYFHQLDVIDLTANPERWWHSPDEAGKPVQSEKLFGVLVLHTQR